VCCAIFWVRDDDCRVCVYFYVCMYIGEYVCVCVCVYIVYDSFARPATYPKTHSHARPIFETTIIEKTILISRAHTANGHNATVRRGGGANSRRRLRPRSGLPTASIIPQFSRCFSRSSFALRVRGPCRSRAHVCIAHRLINTKTSEAVGVVS